MARKKSSHKRRSHKMPKRGKNGRFVKGRR